MKLNSLLFEVRNKVAQVTLHREKAKNALNLDLARELMQVAIRCNRDPEIRSVLIDAKGKIFCPGGDLKAFEKEGDNLHVYLKETSTYLHTAITHFIKSGKPIVVAVNGVAAGAGMSLAISGDIIIAAESARFTAAYSGAGLSPDGGMSYFLPRIVGLRRAQDIVMTNRELSARDALELDLVTHVVPDEQLHETAKATAADIASRATLALGAAKNLLLESFNETLETQLEKESVSLSNMAQTADAHEGIAAFLEKRKPKFIAR